MDAVSSLNLSQDGAISVLVNAEAATTPCGVRGLEALS